MTTNKAIYLKDGTKLRYSLAVPKDPGTEPTYSYKFPRIDGNGRVKMLWAKKVRPIADLTKYLSLKKCKRYTHYNIEYSAITQQYTYWFQTRKMRDMLAVWLPLSGISFQPVKGKGHKFAVKCPHCNTVSQTEDIEWVI